MQGFILGFVRSSLVFDDEGSTGVSEKKGIYRGLWLSDEYLGCGADGRAAWDVGI